MTTWILIITIYLYSNFHDVSAITSEQIQYATQKECVAAAQFLQKKKSEGVKNPRYRITSFCIPGGKIK